MFKIVKKLYSKLPTPVKNVTKFLAFIGIIYFCVILVTAVYNIYATRAAISEQHEAMMIKIQERNENKNSNSGLASKDPFAVKRNEYAQEDELDYTYRVEFLDVGAADCTVLTNGVNTLIIDTGDAEDGMYIVDHLIDNGLDTVSIVCTNQNPEHVGGLPVLLQELNVEELIIPCVSVKCDVMKNSLQIASANGVTVREAKALDAWNVDEAQVQILSAEDNLIIRISLQSCSFLLMSDASPEEEQALMESGLDISATILKVATHGSPESFNSRFIGKVAPKYAIVSCDKNVAEPNRTMLNNIRKEAIVFRTDKHNTLVILTDGVTYDISSEGTDCNG